MGRTIPYEKQYIRKDGSRWWALFAATRITADEGVEFIIDITERKLAEEKLRESEERFRTMADSSPVMIWVTNAAGRIEFVNRSYLDFFGITREKSRAAGLVRDRSFRRSRVPRSIQRCAARSSAAACARTGETSR